MTGLEALFAIAVIAGLWWYKSHEQALKHARERLDQQQHEETCIVDAYKRGLAPTEIASLFQTNVEHVCSVLNRNGWKGWDGWKKTIS